MTIARYNLAVTPRYAFAAVTCKGFCVVCWGNAISTGSVKIFGCTAPMLLLWDRIPFHDQLVHADISMDP